MPRTFRYDHFTAQKPNVSRSLKNKEKQRVSMAEEEEKMEEMTEAGLHYGKRHAQTEEMARVKAASHDAPSQASAAAKPADAAQGSAAAEERPKPTPRSAPANEVTDAQSRIAPADVTTPPPAMPTVESAQPRGLFQVLDDGRGQLEAMSRSVLEFGRASVRLVQLSFELTWLATKTLLSARS